MTRNSIGLIELGSIAAGYEVTDAMLKTADVELILSRSICSGKFMVMVRGDVAAVQSSVESGSRAGAFSVIDTFVIPNVHQSIFPAIAGTAKIETLEALGIIATFRFLFPGRDVRVCGGREVVLRDMQSWIFYAGANGAMLGNYLTTAGRGAEEDIRMVQDLGLRMVPE